jgi:hypothetical protein
MKKNTASTLARMCTGIGFSAIVASGALAGVVTNTADSGPGSLRAVLAAAAPGETITFFLPSPSTITLASELPITQSVVIQGPSAKKLTISDASGRVFHLDTAAKTVTISGLHLSGQTASGNGGAILNDGGDLTIQFCLIDNSSAPLGEGGAIRNNFNGSTGYSLTIQNSTITGNSAAKSAGVYFLGFLLTIENSTIYNNHASDSSGAIGLFSGFAHIYNSTIASNTANTVGGITSQDSQLTFESTIVANNTDLSGINDLNRTGGGNGSAVNATNSLFSENFVPADNVINGTNVSNQVGVDPLLGPLANNGGPTPTLRPSPTGPAIGAGINLQDYAFDQRGPGFPRDASLSGAPGNVDVGAIQAFVVTRVPSAATPVPSLQPWALLMLPVLLLAFAARRKWR